MNLAGEGSRRARVGPWLAAHRSGTLTSLASTLVVALIATLAVVSGGYTAQRLDLNDAAVWVANESRQAVGRANTAVLELNTVVETGRASLDVRQAGETVLVVDRANSSLEILDPATAELSDSVALPPNAPEVLLAGDRTVVAANGDVWNLSTAQVADFDSVSSPDLALGSGSVVSLDSEGLLFSYTPATDTLVSAAVQTSDRITASVTVDGGDPDDVYDLTSVDGDWALLNVTRGILYLDDREVDLSALLTDGAALQAATPRGDRVLVAHAGGLIAVPLGGGEPQELVAGRNGVSAQPISVDGCDYAAWADGAAWQSCASATGTRTGDGEVATLDSLAGDARLQFQVNGTGVVLNDARNGAAWAVQRGTALIDNWDELIDSVVDPERVEENLEDAPEFEDTQLPPVAEDDEFGGRPGHAVTLPVLLNDYDPNDDVLMITDVTPIDPAQGQLDLIANSQQIQLTVGSAAQGTFDFDYTISDGRGGTAAATVTIAVRQPGENSAPVQVRASTASVEAGSATTTQILGDWVDPDGDPFYLTAANVAAPDTVSSTPNGAVTFTHGGTSASDGGGADSTAEGAVQVGLVVSDGSLDGTGTLNVTVRPVGAVPIVADTFLVLATAGAEVTVSPLEHVRGGSGALRLSTVPAKSDVTITTDVNAGTFRFLSSVVGPHYLEFVVTDDSGTTAVGQVRVQVTAADDAASTPITVPHTAFIRGQESVLVDVLAGDIDPGGGVLLVTGTMNVPGGSGLRVEVLDQRLLRVTLTKPLDGPVSFSYRVSNGLASADGTVTVIELPALARKQAPVARPDSISVRVGDAIDIPVLANDEHPDGDPLTLAAELATPLGGDAGLLFVAGSGLRYLAPDAPGNFTAVYRVNAPDGQFANAEVSISVREVDRDANRPPIPKTVTARVLAGETVRIPIPLAGIDPDGDSVQLLGQETNPEKGAVTGVGADWIEFESGDYAAGTDSFSYAVIDALGARATGLVRVGISARLDGARNPIAAPDEVVVRPGSTVSVRVLANDSDPDGGDLSLLGVEPTDAAGIASIDGDVISVQAPNAEGRTGFIYEIQNERGGTGSSFLTVVVDRDAPRAHPDARDTVLTLSDVLDRSTIDVDVLDRVFFAEGPASELVLGVLPGYARDAEVTNTQRIRVTLGDDSQIIPFSVTHPDDESIVSYAFIWVPGYSDALPQLRTNVAPLTIASESSLSITINEYVVAVGGKNVSLTDEAAVRASHSDGADLVESAERLVFTSADGYYGPASISFEVTDARRAGDSEARIATIVLPITVTPRENQPPAFDGAVLDFEPDQTTVIDLQKLTSYPYPDAVDELVYSVLEPDPTGFDYSLAGSLLTIHAGEGTEKGSESALAIGVRDDLSEGTAGRIDLNVVASTKPLAIPAADQVLAPRGQTTVVDVLANDTATNPFPAVPLRVVAVRGLDGSGVPAGVTITPSADRSRLSVTVAAGADPVDTTVQYQVADATGDPDRYAWGTVRVSVQDVPDPVSRVTVTGFGDETLSLSFNAGAANNAAITGYDITLTDADSGAPVGTSTCAATTCTVPTGGNGQAHSVRVSVTALNALGPSAAASFANAVWSDVVPAAPTGLTAAPLDAALRLGWKTVAPSAGGTAVRSYVVTVNGSERADVSATACSAGACSLVVDGLSNGSVASYTVSARNEAFPALSTWNSGSGDGTPYGAPRAGGLTATATDASGRVSVSWNAFDGAGSAIGGYFVQRIAGDSAPTGAQGCSVSEPAPGALAAPRTGGVVEEQQTMGAAATSATFEVSLADNRSYSFVVWGYNQAGCAVTAVTTVSVSPVPGEITSVQGTMELRGQAPDAIARDYHLTGVEGAGSVASYYELRNAGSGRDRGERLGSNGDGWPRELLGDSFGETVDFELRACNAAGICGAWSDSFRAPEASVSLAVRGVAYDADAGVFSWTNAPDNGADHPATFECSANANPAGTLEEADSDNTCTLAEPAAAGGVTLTVTVDGTSYDYRD
ncbi:Ig-like domain-containing protein [Cryobacterium melibiosiphilum]|uniref:Ig-like domain-containing protein n=1 Tax=Cryobacterium melibiosiphilum TaxID=995039 RepID=UPI0013149B31|nr:Ig-like domain-containing protein [Cryobacterium melibiosiphilum]